MTIGQSKIAKMAMSFPTNELFAQGSAAPMHRQPETALILFLMIFAPYHQLRRNPKVKETYAGALQGNGKGKKRSLSGKDPP
jgi:hypothetical protein